MNIPQAATGCTTPSDPNEDYKAQAGDLVDTLPDFAPFADDCARDLRSNYQSVHQRLRGHHHRHSSSVYPRACVPEHPIHHFRKIQIKEYEIWHLIRQQLQRLSRHPERINDAEAPPSTGAYRDQALLVIINDKIVLREPFAVSNPLVWIIDNNVERERFLSLVLNSKHTPHSPKMVKNHRNFRPLMGVNPREMEHDQTDSEDVELSATRGD